MRAFWKGLEHNWLGRAGFLALLGAVVIVPMLGWALSQWNSRQGVVVGETKGDALRAILFVRESNLLDGPLEVRTAFRERNYQWGKHQDIRSAQVYVEGTQGFAAATHELRRRAQRNLSAVLGAPERPQGGPWPLLDQAAYAGTFTSRWGFDEGAVRKQHPPGKNP